jgi:hypothetical protein
MVFNAAAPLPGRRRQQKTPASRGFFQPPANLRRLDVCSLLALGASGDFEADALVFLQRLEAPCLNLREVREEIIATTVRSNKTKALGIAATPSDQSRPH